MEGAVRRTRHAFYWLGDISKGTPCIIQINADVSLAIPRGVSLWEQEACFKLFGGLQRIQRHRSDLTTDETASFLPYLDSRRIDADKRVQAWLDKISCRKFNPMTIMWLTDSLNSAMESISSKRDLRRVKCRFSQLSAAH